MRIIAHGIDLVDIARVERMLAVHGHRFEERCFSPGERAYANAGRRRRAERFAVRLACKEAVMKALGTGWRSGIAWTDIEVVRSPSGQPHIALAGRSAAAAAHLGIDQWHLSLTHTESQAAASVIACSSRPADDAIPMPRSGPVQQI